MASFLESAAPLIAAYGAINSGDPSGLLSFLQRQKKAVASDAFVNERAKELKLSPEMANAIMALPPDERLQALGQITSQQNALVSQGLRQQAEERQAEDLKLKKGDAARKAQERADKKAQDAAIQDTFKTQIALFSPEKQVSLNNLLAAGKRTGSYDNLNKALAPELGTPGHLITQIQAGKESLDPESIRTYFKANIKNTKQARAQAENFIKNFVNQPEDKRSLAAKAWGLLPFTSAPDLTPTLKPEAFGEAGIPNVAQPAAPTAPTAPQYKVGQEIEDNKGTRLIWDGTNWQPKSK